MKIQVLELPFDSETGRTPFLLIFSEVSGATVAETETYDTFSQRAGAKAALITSGEVTL